MFKLNLKIAWRNLWKNKVHAAINIGRLALGLTAFVLMLLYINYEESYDRSPDLKNVYQIREKHDFFTPDNKEHWQNSTDSRMAALVRENIPNAIAVTKVDQEWDWNQGYSIKVDHANPVMIEYHGEIKLLIFNRSFNPDDYPRLAIPKPGDPKREPGRIEVTREKEIAYKQKMNGKQP